MTESNAAITRRTLLGAGAGLIGSLLVSGARLYSDSPLRVIDTHIHFYDPVRQGPSHFPVPDTPEAFRKMAEPLGVRGAIVVETSQWFEDNQWILDLAARNRIIVGYVGHLKPGTSEFRQQLLHFRKNPIFLGIRYGNLWGWDLGRALQRPDFVSDIKLLANEGLELDAVLDGPASTPNLDTVMRLTDLVPNLRVVIDHLPFYLEEGPPRLRYRAGLQELQSRPQVYAKISGVLRKVGDRVPGDMNFYRSALDELWDTFGSDRVVYGSNWPPSEYLAPYSEILRVVREYFATRGEAASKKFFWDNSIQAYRWIARK